MKQLQRVLYQMVKADFLERVRRYSFLVTLAGTLWLAYGVIAEKITIVVGDGDRGVYNSAWIGTLMAVCCSSFLSLCGFYIVKNSVERDSSSRVGRILAATPMSKAAYTVAKTISNFAVLASMVLVLMIAAVGMQFLRPEARPISLWHLWMPLLLIGLPAMFLTASLALFFETVPGLRGGMGNVIYFFVWTALIVSGAQAGVDDPAGIQLFSSSARQALEKMNLSGGPVTGFSLSIGGRHASRTFLWNGVDWTAQIVLERFVWIAAGIGLAFLASIFFHRFDPAREKIRVRGTKISAAKTTLDDSPLTIEARNASSVFRRLTVPATRGQARFGTLALRELSLMIKGLHWWWYAVAVGLLVGELASPSEAAREGLLLVAWIWPVLVWSEMGCRESRYGTQSLIFSAERIAYRQLAALWVAGISLALLIGAGTGLRLLLSSNWEMLAAWIAGALFIPGLALASGVWSGSSKFFEALYTVWWYVGAMHQIPTLDFMGGTRASSSPVLYLSIAAGLFITACLGRRWQVAYA